MHPFPRYIDSTMRSTFVSCPRKFYWEYIRHLAPTAISVDLHAGAAFAAAVETTRIAYYAKHMAYDDAVLAGVTTLMREWGDFEPPEGHAKSFTNVAQAFVEYWREYDPRFDTLRPHVSPSGTIATEFSFALPINVMHPTTGEPLIYCGRFDMLGYFDGAPDLLWIVDEKTTTQIGTRWADKWSMRGQFFGYAWGAREYGFNIEGAVIRGIGIQKTQYKFAQAMPSIANWQIDRWHAQLLRDAQRMVAAHRAGWFDYAYGDACESYGGCPMLDLCTTRWPEQLVSSFAVRPWNPLDRNPTEPHTEPAA